MFYTFEGSTLQTSQTMTSPAVKQNSLHKDELSY